MSRLYLFYNVAWTCSNKKIISIHEFSFSFKNVARQASFKLRKMMNEEARQTYLNKSNRNRGAKKLVLIVKTSKLTLSKRMSLSYRRQSIDLLCKSMDWFLYDRDFHLERVREVMEISQRIHVTNQCFERSLFFLLLVLEHIKNK